MSECGADLAVCQRKLALDLSAVVMHSVSVKTPTEGPDWKRLGRYIKARREQLRLSQQDMSARGGPSVATIRNLEAGDQPSYRNKTYYQVEDSLDWTPGSVDAVLSGKEPVFRQKNRTPEVAPDESGTSGTAPREGAGNEVDGGAALTSTEDAIQAALARIEMIVAAKDADIARQIAEQTAKLDEQGREIKDLRNEVRRLRTTDGNADSQQDIA